MRHTKQPMLYLFLLLLISSLLGILIEYVTNQSFVRSGLYSTLGLFLIAIIYLKIKRK